MPLRKEVLLLADIKINSRPMISPSPSVKNAIMEGNLVARRSQDKLPANDPTKHRQWERNACPHCEHQQSAKGNGNQATAAKLLHLTPLPWLREACSVPDPFITPVYLHLKPWRRTWSETGRQQWSHKRWQPCSEMTCMWGLL